MYNTRVIYKQNEINQKECIDYESYHSPFLDMFPKLSSLFFLEVPLL